MKHDKVGAVMTTEIVTATRDTPFKEVARLLSVHRIRGVPVVDEDVARSTTARVHGVVAVVGRPKYRMDDSGPRAQEQAVHGVADDRLRRL